MTFLGFCQWIERSPLGAGVRDSVWIFPVVESIHILGIVLLFFTAALVDLRVLGTGFLRRRSLAEVAVGLLPWMWRAVVLVIATGILLFSSEAASKCYESKAFYVKMALIVIAVANAAFSGMAITYRATHEGAGYGPYENDGGDFTGRVGRRGVRGTGHRLLLI